MDDLNKRKGFVKISNALLIKGASSGLLKSLYSVIYPISIEKKSEASFDDVVYIYGYSKAFDVVSEGSLIPQYEMSANIKNNNVMSISVKKIEK